MNSIVSIAESWLGTPFVHGACIKGQGVDCSKFIFSVFQEYGHIKKKDLPPHLPPDWNLMPVDKIDKDIFIKQLLRYGIKIPYDDREPGDVISFLYNGIESHVAILVEDDCIIHAVREKKVKKQRLRRYKGNICSVYRMRT